MLHSKYLIQDNTLSNIMNGIKEILQPSSSITLPEAITLLSASEQYLYLSMPYYIKYDDNVWPTQVVNDTTVIINRETGESAAVTISKNVPLLFFDIQEEHADELGQNLREAHLDSVPYIPTSAFRSCSNLKYASINTSGSIGNEAFRDCYNLQDVYLATNIGELPLALFANCYNLTNFSISISSSIFHWNQQGSYYFSNCSNLKSIYLNLQNLSKFVFDLDCGFANLSTLETVIMDANSQINFSILSSLGTVGIFENCYNLKNFICPDLSILFSRMFRNCYNLQSINLPKVTSQPAGYAFQSCYNLVSVSLPLLSTGRGLFFGCSKLTDVTLSSNFKPGYETFRGCENLSVEQILEQYSITSIPGSCFYGCKNLTILSSPLITNIDIRGFEDCVNLTTINLPNTTSISVGAFAYCTNLTNVNLPAIEFIPSECFNKCFNLSNLSIPNCTIIGENAFRQCSNLINVEFPNCTYVSEDAFTFCRQLTNVNISKCTTIEGWAFQECNSLTSINLQNCISIGQNAFISCSNLINIELPNCTSISHGAFNSCIQLKTFNAPELLTISPSAFQDCYSLNTINLQNCTSIGWNAFMNCSGLTFVSIPKCSFIGPYAFQNCSLLSQIILNSSSMTNITTSIFNGCSNLEKIVVGSLVSEYKNDSYWSQYADYIVSQ